MEWVLVIIKSLNKILSSRCALYLVPYLLKSTTIKNIDDYNNGALMSSLLSSSIPLCCY